MAELSEVHDSERKPSGLAVLFSAVVFPGVGQYMQGRRLTGAFYAVIFLLCVVFLFTAIFKPLFLNLRILEGLTNNPETIAFYAIPWKNILSWTVVSLFVYLVNLLDVFVCYRRRSKIRSAKYEIRNNIEFKCSKLKT